MILNFIPSYFVRPKGIKYLSIYNYLTPIFKGGSVDGGEYVNVTDPVEEGFGGGSVDDVEDVNVTEPVGKGLL